MNVQISRAETFLYTFDYKGEFTRLAFAFHTSSEQQFYFGYSFSNSFDDPTDSTHYPFQGGVSHADDITYLFPYPVEFAKLNENDTKMAKKMVDLWTSFAIDGVPTLSEDHNGLNPVRWTPFSGEEMEIILHLNRLRSLYKCRVCTLYPYQSKFNFFFH